MSLKAIIDAQGRKQSWVATQLGIPQSTFHAMVHDRARLPADQVVPLANLLGVSTKDILKAIRKPTESGAPRE